MSSIRVTTNFRDNFGADLGTKLVTKDYLMSVYPGIAQELGKTPELLVWGANEYNQLGTNTTVPAVSTPITTFAGGTNWKQACADFRYNSAIKTDGTLWVWGNQYSGNLGINATGRRSTPVTTFAGGTNWKQVDISKSTGAFAAVKTDGTLWTWGNNFRGGVGNNTNTDRSTPVTTFAGGTNWKQVSAGDSFVAAIKTDGTLWTWGYGFSLGNNTTSDKCTPVTTFAGGTNWKQVSAGYRFMAAIKTDGTLWVWGGNSYSGQLGINRAGPGPNVLTPVTTFAGGTNWKQVSCGSNIMTAIKTDGTLWTWGYATDGRLGNNSTSPFRISTPVTTFAGGTNWKQVSCGANVMTAIKTDGTLWTWGNGYAGKLGINASGNRLTPVTTFAGGTNWKQVSCGEGTLSAIRSADFI